MKVYPVNLCDGAEIRCGEIAGWSGVNLIVSKHLEHPADFVGETATIRIRFSEAAPVDTFIIGNTGSTAAVVRATGADGNVVEEVFDRIENMIEIRSFGRMLATGVSVTLSGRRDSWLGYFFAGLAWELPRFAVEPQAQLEPNSKGGRTFTGQAIGVRGETLRNLSVEFTRITAEETKLVDTYIEGVQSVIPHVVDAYPEARDRFPPMFATVSGAGTKTKRAENGWYWNTSLSWQEAK